MNYFYTRIATCINIMSTVWPCFAYTYVRKPSKWHYDTLVLSLGGNGFETIIHWRRVGI